MAKLKEEIGRDSEIPESYFLNSEATRDSFRHFAEGMADFNPLWRDDVAASQTRFGGVIAPPTWLCTTFAPFGFGSKLRPFGWQGLDGETKWRYFAPVRPGYRFKVVGRVVDVALKETKSIGPAILITGEVDYMTQEGKLLARATASMWYFRAENSQTDKVQTYEPDPNPITADDAIRDVEQRGATPRYWEDVAVGDTIRFIRPTLTSNEIIAWVVGSQTTGWARSIQKRLASGERGPWDSNSAAGVARHIDPQYARADGLPAAFDVGAQRNAWLGQLVTDWMGDAGDLIELSCRYRKLIFVGDTPTCIGVVTEKYREDGRNLVAFDLSVENQRGETPADGKALVALPSREV